MNKELCYAECEMIDRLAREYEFYCIEYYQELCQKVIRYEYGRDESTLHRGYYCPSKIEDLVVGNTVRGRLLKQFREDVKINYKYGFDSAGRLLTIDNMIVSKCEFILYQGNTQIGIEFDQGGTFRISNIAISTCNEEGNIVSYGSYLFDEKNQVMDFRKENYIYHTDKMIVDVYHFFNDKNAILSCERYVFSIEDGYLSTYTVEFYTEDQERIPSIWDGHVFKVYKRRKYM